MFVSFFFVKQKTAYELRISDCSSDVCSSDLPTPRFVDQAGIGGDSVEQTRFGQFGDFPYIGGVDEKLHGAAPWIRFGGCYTPSRYREAIPIREIGRATCRERVCQYV